MENHGSVTTAEECFVLPKEPNKVFSLQEFLEDGWLKQFLEVSFYSEHAAAFLTFSQLSPTSSTEQLQW